MVTCVISAQMATTWLLAWPAPVTGYLDPNREGHSDRVPGFTHLAVSCIHKGGSNHALQEHSPAWTWWVPVSGTQEGGPARQL